MVPFIEATPTPETNWRAIILFGRNVASYKFALGKSLIELANREATFVRLEDLAEPFSRHLCKHLKQNDKQATSPRSEFLAACRNYNQKLISHDELLETTVKRGFANVIDAFHVVNQAEVSTRFFTDERKGRVKGILVTDELLALRETFQWQNLPDEVEARWRLVETAWSLDLALPMLQVEHDRGTETFSVASALRRVSITSSRDALNGYQKGKCFYCFKNVSVLVGSIDLADVDHFFPHTLKATGLTSVDGVWNLVLACQECNRGTSGKFARIPELRYLERLNKRNNFLVSSHHPLRETIMNQTGATETDRRTFLQRVYNDASHSLVALWRPVAEFEAAF